MRFHRVTLFALAVCVFTSRGFAADWTQFRGPGGLGVSAETGLPAKWSSKENIAWNTAMFSLEDHLAGRPVSALTPSPRRNRPSRQVVLQGKHSLENRASRPRIFEPHYNREPRVPDLL